MSRLDGYDRATGTFRFRFSGRSIVLPELDGNELREWKRRLVAVGLGTIDRLDAANSRADVQAVAESHLDQVAELVLAYDVASVLDGYDRVGPGLTGRQIRVIFEALRDRSLSRDE